MTLFLLLAITQPQQTSVPKELLIARQNRTLAAKGRIAWSFRTEEAVYHCTTRFAGDEWINERVVPGLPDQSIIELHKDGEYWAMYGDDSIVCRISQAPLGVYDARAIGFSPRGMTENLDHITADPLSFGVKIAKKTYTVTDDATYRVITTHITTEGGGIYTMKQWLDPDKGFGVVKSQEFFKDRLTSESITLLREDAEGHWFPSATNVYQAGENEPSFTITVEETIFDDESLPDSLGPEDIGVEIGTNIRRKGAGSRDLMSWDGEKLAPFIDVARKINRGELEKGPRVKAVFARLQAKDLVRKAVNQKIKEAGDADTHKQWSTRRSSDNIFRAWELYVLRFIKFYGLDAGQHNGAMSIYRTIRETGETYLRRKQSDFETLNKKINDLASLSETKNKLKVVDELANERVRLERPLIELFNNKLKPRLASLLTRKQQALGEMK